MFFSKKYMPLIPVHCILLINAIEVIDLCSTNQFNIQDTFTTYIVLASALILECWIYRKIKNGI